MNQALPNDKSTITLRYVSDQTTCFRQKALGSNRLEVVDDLDKIPRR